VLQTSRLKDLLAEDLSMPDLDEEVENVQDTEASGVSKAVDTSEISTPLLPTPESTPEPSPESATEVENNELESYERPRDDSPSRILLESLQDDEIQSLGGEPTRVRRPRQEVDPSNIVKGRRSRKV
jgi:hypothetical protein